MTTESSTSQTLYNQWNESLYNSYMELFRESTFTVWDGVISPEDYAHSRLKVMLLNREAYDENVDDLAGALYDCISKEEVVFPGQTTLRTHLKQYLAVLDSGQNGFLGLSDEYVRERVKAMDYYEFTRLLKRVAYCNIKKSDGKTRSNIKDLREYAIRGLDVLKEQILFFNPSVILAGNVCDGILDDLFDWGENLYQDPVNRINIWQLKIGDRLFPFVDMFHPSLVKGMSEYYIELLHALQEVEKDRPDFWIGRQRDGDCFLSR